MDVEVVAADVEESATHLGEPARHDVIYTTDVPVSVTVKSVRMICGPGFDIVVALDKVIESAVVVLVGSGTTVGGCVGAPGKPGSGWGVANASPLGPKMRTAESCTSVKSIV